MKRLTAFAFLALLCSCGRGDSAGGSGGPPDPLAVAVDAYSNHRISADSAARVYGSTDAARGSLRRRTLLRI